MAQGRRKGIVLTIGITIFLLGLAGTLMSLFDYNLVIAGAELEAEMSYILLGVGALILIVYLVVMLVKARGDRSG
ncbi:MAG: hypothetical protein A2Y64_06830 [Candidatus Coatesbacteria bacterium RBG_13_66_14]|uniref:Uncharacterized protein n=1 Tax=Candidatus Coatesbacteria bacterium RBG_13_66_14 TaxID=1817816 RepID=A0A1F5EXX7_9BACT|nr:MAG: hypothetical protein A2Y64_06830 [Candidatus Coatesbacteria bacterium RBG_13_66_14]